MQRVALNLPTAARFGLALGFVAHASLASLAGCSTAQSLPCPNAAASSCPSLDGVTSFCSWSEWGCARETACGGYFVIHDEGSDARFTYYYAATTGAFVATVQEASGGGNATCLAGPASFQPPSDCDFDTLADCDPLPRDGGANGARDASADAPFGAPSPSGSPSTQPLATPPTAFPPYAPR